MLFSSEASPSSPIDPLLVPVTQRDEDEDVTPTAVDEVPLVLPVVPPDSSSTHIGHQVSKEMTHPDTLSEAGTYTLDADGRNVDVEKARQMIDNVFGVSRNATYSNVRQGMQSGSVPASPQPRRRTMRQQSRTNDSNCSNDSSGNNNTDNDFRHRTFTRSKSGRRGSSSDNPSSPTFDTSQFDRVYNSRHYAAKQSLSSNVPRSPRLPVRNRQNSCSSSKSGGSNKTVDVKKGNVSIGAQASKGSPVFHRKRVESSSGARGSSESLTGSIDSEVRLRSDDQSNAASSSGLKFNRAFALKRAMLGLDTRGLNITMTDEKVQKNLEKRASDPRNRVSMSPAFSRDDGGRFSLRVGSRKPPTCPSTPTKKVTKKTSSGRGESLKLSPASSTNSIPSSFVQKSSSFSQNSGQGSSFRGTMNQGMSSCQVAKRMFSTKPHQQQQMMLTDVRSRQQANVAPIKRDQQVHQQNSSSTAQSMASGLLHEPLNENASSSRPSPNVSSSTTMTSPPSSSQSNRRTLSSLDNLVVSAILQLSVKIRRGMREWLEQEKLKHPSGSETRLMIDEILPQVSNVDASNHSSSPYDALSACNENLSKDLSNILKNLKKVEQSMEGECNTLFVALFVSSS